MVYFKDGFDVFLRFGKIQPIIKAVICWVIVIIGSLIHDFHRPPDSYFSDKENVFNVVFVKYALLWTLGVLAPFVVVSSHMKSEGSVSAVSKNTSRFLVFVVIWYLVTAVFDFVLDLTGICEGSELFSTKETCEAEGLIWKGYDISGHCFLLTYSTLVISEEIQALCFWHDKKHSLPWKQYCRVGKPIANFFYICSCLLILLWEAMLVSTSVYFHTVETKVIGVLIGLFSWTVTYKFWFEKDLSPGIPRKL